MFCRGVGIFFQFPASLLLSYEIQIIALVIYLFKACYFDMFQMLHHTTYLPFFLPSPSPKVVFCLRTLAFFSDINGVGVLLIMIGHMLNGLCGVVVVLREYGIN